MAKKDITIDTLAKMIKEGFDKTVTLVQFEEQAEFINKKFDKIDKDLAIIKSQLAGVVYRPDFDKLESRVEYLENILALKKN